MAVALALHGTSSAFSPLVGTSMLTYYCSFESREACEEVIKSYNNNTVEDNQVQIRYADTHEQKMLKQQTQAARQFRSTEYEYATQAWRQGRLPYAGTTLNDNVTSNTGNEFEQYLGSSATVPIQNQRWAQSAIRHAPGRSPLGATPYTSNAAANETPLAQASVNPTKDGQTSSGDDAALDTKPLSTSPATAHATSPAASAAVVAATEQE